MDVVSTRSTAAGSADIDGETTRTLAELRRTV